MTTPKSIPGTFKSHFLTFQNRGLIGVAHRSVPRFPGGRCLSSGGRFKYQGWA